MKNIMRFCLSAGVSLASPFLLAADPAAAEEASSVPVEEGDIIPYPHAMEPVEVTAGWNGLDYACSIGPGDFFKVNYVSIGYTGLRKTAGRKGDQTYCHKGSSILVQGIEELTKSQEGIPETVSKIFYPFVYDMSSERTNLLKSRTITGETPESAQGLLITEGDTVAYPVNKKPIETQAVMNGMLFHCNIMPGDSFNIVQLTTFPRIHSDDMMADVMLRKSAGAPGNQTVCPFKAAVFRETTECLLKRTGEGVPEGIVCPFSPQEVFEKLAVDD